MYSVLGYYSRVGTLVRSHTAAINAFYLPPSDKTPPPQTKGIILCCSSFFFLISGVLWKERFLCCASGDCCLCFDCFVILTVEL